MRDARSRKRFQVLTVFASALDTARRLGSPVNVRALMQELMK